MMKKLLRLATFALLFTGAASAQTTGSITGVVTDGATGKPVVGAVVVATSPAAPGEQTAVTDAKGAFTIANLPAGSYKLNASFEGYKPETRTDLALGENVTLRANLAIVPEAVQLEEVVVTGSRIRRKDLTTAAPVSVVNKEAITASGQVSVGDFLNTMPEAVAALGRGNNNGGDGTVKISLRGLGSSRTLVLVNGRRWVAGGSGANSSVDLNTLPASAIERIEVLKDGASAVYGSDAIGGVVNVITKKNFNGAEFNAYAGTSSKGDGNTYDVNGTFGTTSEKGSLLFSTSFTRQDAVWAGDRSFSKDALQANYKTGKIRKLGSSTIPNGAFEVNVLNCGGGTPAQQALCADLASTYAADLYPSTSTTADTLYLTHDPTLAGHGGYRPYGADSWNYAPFNYLYTPSQRYSFFTSGDYKLNDYAKFYFEGSYMNRRTDQKLAPVPLLTAYLGDNGAVLSAASQYNPFGTDIFWAQSRLVNLSNRTEAQDTDTTRVVTGLNGSLANWFWDASFTFGRTSGTDTVSGVVRSDLVAAAIGPSNGGKCYSTATPDPANPGQYIYSGEIPGCVPLNLLQGPAPADQVANLSFTGPNKGFTQEAIWAANVSGELFNLASDRPVALAAGVEHRTEQGAFIVNPFNAAGLGTDYNSGSTQGGYHVNEAFAELSIPLVNNLPYVYDLEASLAGRYSNYSTYGGNSTYKIGLRYSPIRDVTVRGTYSTAFRAPSIGELFAGNAQSFPSVNDPCAGNPAGPGSPGYIDPTSALGVQCGVAVNNGDQQTQQRETLGGNANLKPETATIYTVGLVLEPRMVEGLSVTLDYYDTTVKKTINAIGIGTILNGCYPGAGGTPNAQFCGLISRLPNNRINIVTDTNQNVGELRTSGIDIAGNYRLSTAAAGKFNFGVEGTYLLKDDWIRPDGSTVHARGTYDYGYADPTFKANGAVQWAMSGLTAGVGGRYVGGFKECGDAAGVSGTANLCADTPTYYHMVSSYWNFNANVGYGFTSTQGKTNVTLGMTNLFNQAPPRNFNAFANAADTAYDYMGRFFYARLNHTF